MGKGYDYSLLRKHNWFNKPKYASKGAIKDYLKCTINHLKKWKKYGQYDYWNTDEWMYSDL